MLIGREKQSSWEEEEEEIAFLRIFPNTRIKEMAGKKRGADAGRERGRGGEMLIYINIYIMRGDGPHFEKRALSFLYSFLSCHLVNTIYTLSTSKSTYCTYTMAYYSHDGDDDMSLADMMSMKINVSSPSASDKKVIFWVGFFSIAIYGVSMLFLCTLIFNSFTWGGDYEAMGLQLECVMGERESSIFTYNYAFDSVHLLCLSYPFSSLYAY